jgi:NTE family protein/lysophospholipid hydrolase
MSDQPDHLSEAELRKLFSESGYFGPPDDAVIRELADASEVVHVRGGDRVVRGGLPLEFLYTVVYGRLRNVVADAEGEGRHVNELARGVSVGLGGLLTGRPYLTDVYAVRDSVLLRTPKRDFERIVTNHPDLLLRFLKKLATRFEEFIGTRVLETGALTEVERIETNVAFIPVDESGSIRESADSLARAFGEYHKVLHLTARDVDAALGEGASTGESSRSSDRDVIAWLHQRESEFEGVLYEADLSSPAWTERCLRHADLVVIAARGGSRAPIKKLNSLLAKCRVDRGAARVDLLLVHKADTALPTRANAWSKLENLSRIHHVREKRDADYRRVARIMSRRAVGLVLGGGGARGIAHVGVLKALEEADVPIDFISGTSMGSIFAGGYAKGWSPEVIMENVRRVFSPRWALYDPTLPILAMMRGRKLEGVLKKLFEGVEIEDLWLNFHCVSSNLTHAGAFVHDRGDLWKSIRASCSIPGIFPPVKFGEQILIDGGIVDNLPIATMRERCERGTVIAVDVAGSEAPEAVEEFGDIDMTWKTIGDRLNPFTESKPAPHILYVLQRTAMINSSRNAQTALSSNQADLLLTPPLEEFGLLDWSAHDALYEAGYRYAAEALSQWKFEPKS